MKYNIPLDIKAETLLAYLPKGKRTIELKGSHKRNAYEDIADVSEDESGIANVSIARNGMYDILPENMFHPIDRYDNIPANEYKERFREECEQQYIEEENARKYFSPYDNALLELSTIISGIKNEEAYNSTLVEILCDSFPERYKNNRFIRKSKQYMPLCRHIRGNKGLLSLMLRHILFDENIILSERLTNTPFRDENPRYNCCLVDSVVSDTELFLGNDYDENITIFDIHYWNDDECKDSFLNFIEEMGIFEEFLNDYFIGIECKMRFDISTESLPVRLSDDKFFTYLDFNTNI